YRTVAPVRAPTTTAVYLPPAVRPGDADLRKAADLLNAGQKVGILVGVGARGAGDLVESAAEVLGAPVVKTLSGKMVIADDSPYTTGGLGLRGTAPSEDLMDDIDTLLMLGTNFPYSKFLPKDGKTKIVQVDIEPARTGTRIATDLPLVGDVRETLQALLPMLQTKSHDHLQRY